MKNGIYQAHVYSRFRFRQQILFVRFMFVQMVSDLHKQRGQVFAGTHIHVWKRRIFKLSFWSVYPTLFVKTYQSLQLMQKFMSKMLIFIVKKYWSTSWMKLSEINPYFLQNLFWMTRWNLSALSTVANMSVDITVFSFFFKYVIQELWIGHLSKNMQNWFEGIDNVDLSHKNMRIVHWRPQLHCWGDFSGLLLRIA